MFKEIRLSLILRIIAILLGVVGSVLIARLGGPEVKGVSSAFAAAATIGYTIINFDSAQAALRFARESSDHRNSWNYLSRVWALYSGIILIGLMLLLVLDLPLGWYLLGTVFFGVAQQAGVLSVASKGAFIGSLGVGVQQLSLIASVLLFNAFSELNELNVKLVILISYAIPLLLYLPTFLIPRRDMPELKTRQLLTLMLSSVPWQLGRVSQALLQKFDVLMIFALFGAAQSGIYSVGVSTAMLVTLVPAQFAAQALHDISNHHKLRSDKHVIAAIISGVVSSLPLAILGHWVIELAYGTEFQSAYGILLACLPGAIAHGVVQVQSNYIRLLGTWKVFFVVNFSGALVLIVGIYLALVTAEGYLVGAGIAFSLGTMVSALIGNIFLRRTKSDGPPETR